MNNILITSAGRRVSLVNFFKKELRLYFPESKVFTIDSNPDFSAACRVSDTYFKAPKVTEHGYLDFLLQLALKNQIKLIIPTIDTELLVLSHNIDFFKKHDITILISDYDLVKIFRDKRATHDFFQKLDIKIALEYDKDNYKLPLYIKPIDGSRSVDNFIVTEENQLTKYHFENEKLMFLEYIDHKKHIEFTIDLYYDKESNLKCIVPRERIEVREGEVNKAITRNMFFIKELWDKMGKVEGFRGCVTLQVFVNPLTQELTGIEINLRFGGGFPLSYLAGANFPKWIIQEYLLNESYLPIFHDWEKDLMMLRYDSEVLVSNFI